MEKSSNPRGIMGNQVFVWVFWGCTRWKYGQLNLVWMIAGFQSTCHAIAKIVTTIKIVGSKWVGIFCSSLSSFPHTVSSCLLILHLYYWLATSQDQVTLCSWNSSILSFRMLDTVYHHITASLEEPSDIAKQKWFHDTLEPCWTTPLDPPSSTGKMYKHVRNVTLLVQHFYQILLGFHEGLSLGANLLEMPMPTRKRFKN